MYKNIDTNTLVEIGTKLRFNKEGKFYYFTVINIDENDEYELNEVSGIAKASGRIVVSNRLSIESDYEILF